jgi:hypothetical protein
VEVYAGQRGAKLSSAVVDLLERGLTAASDEESISRLEQCVKDLSVENAQLRAEVAAAKTELAAVTTLAQRASRPVGSCPSCGRSISGYDLLATGQCSECSATLSALLAPENRSTSLDQKEFLILVGALGAVVGLALLAGKG